ncbi:hypothetical protein FB451DRAFT_1180012 [Mycena latifolia]|nr:hypothetical protein FB451DRAFT_1180012 [Mycena latifolia]
MHAHATSSTAVQSAVPHTHATRAPTDAVSAPVNNNGPQCCHCHWRGGEHAIIYQPPGGHPRASYQLYNLIAPAFILLTTPLLSIQSPNNLIALALAFHAVLYRIRYLANYMRREDGDGRKK